ncbi:MAG TPA: acetolactate synthase large subunit [Solirubrobacteraceae bacterium]|nr:acetolactate synthase large subunit [Solirubrobacteraceae bacterium]
MNGAESLIRTVATAGVDVCFANPGTTEMHLVQALDDVGAIRPVLGLFEGVCTAAADGYARMAGRPAMTLLHLGPGMANGIANLHNANRARTPLLSVVGEHATFHRDRGAPLASDIEGLAGPVSKWVRTSTAAGAVARDGAEALAAAQSAPGGVATLIVPADCAWSDAGGPADPVAPTPPARVDDARVEAAAAALDGDPPPTLLLGASALTERGLRAAARVAAATACRLVGETFPTRVERGGDLPVVPRLPYFPEEATAELAKGSRLVLAGAPEPIAFFGYPGLPSELAPAGTPVETLAEPADDAADALERLADHLGAPPRAPAQRAPAPSADGDAPADATPLEPLTAVRIVATHQPEGAIVVDEGLTLSAAYVPASAGAPRHTYLALTGGAIGFGLPCAAGAAIAAPDRPVIALQADGSGMYVAQALWTHAREGLDVTTLICANRSYRILIEELRRAGVEQPKTGARAMTSLGDPPLDWVALATGMGVPAARATTAGELTAELRRALAEPGPHLVEMVL